MFGGPQCGPPFFHEQSNIHHVTLKTMTTLKDEIVTTPFPVRSLNVFDWL